MAIAPFFAAPELIAAAEAALVASEEYALSYAEMQAAFGESWQGILALGGLTGAAAGGGLYTEYLNKRKRKHHEIDNGNDENINPTIPDDDHNSIPDTPIMIKKRLRDDNANLYYKRSFRKGKVSKNSLIGKFFNMVSPRVQVYGQYLPDWWGEKQPTTSVSGGAGTTTLSDGSRFIKENSQDICQLAHMTFDEFGQLFIRGLALPKAIRINDMYSHAQGGNSEVGINTNIVSSTSSYTQYRIPTSGTTAAWWLNKNYNLMVEKYIVKYKITNTSEVPIFVELTECKPRYTINGSFYYYEQLQTITGNPPVTTTTQVNVATSVRNANADDPLACLDRDIQESTLEVRERNAINTNLVSPETIFPLSKTKSIFDRGQQLGQLGQYDFNKKWKITNKKIVQINPGNHLDYTFVINGFDRTSYFNTPNGGFELSVNDGAGETEITTVYPKPLFIPQTKFLVLRAWTPSTASAAGSATGIGYPQCTYNVIATADIKFRSIPKGPSALRLKADNGCQMYNHNDPDGSNNAGSNLGTGLNTFINPETNNGEGLVADNNGN